MNDDTIRVYDARAREYADAVDTGKDEAMQAFLAGLPEGGQVLDWGCGPGHAAAAMAAAGLSVLATDGSAEMVRLAQAQPGVDAHQATFDDLTAQEAFDGIWASFSLLHAPRAAMPGHLAAAHRALRSGGAFWIGMKLGSGEKVDRLGRFYTYYSEAELQDCLTEAGFTVLQSDVSEVRGLTGDLEACVAILARA
ncbi:MAG: class I SAM-dependent methyltransferase [Pseudomonadota bacterium]